MTRLKDTLPEDQYTFSIISRSFLFRMRNISEKNVKRNSKHTFYVQFFFFFKNHSFYEIMWEKYCREGQATDDHMEHAHCKHYIPMATAHTQNIVISIAFPLQLWFHERASVLRYLYIASLVLHTYRYIGTSKCQKTYEFEVWKRK